MSQPSKQWVSAWLTDWLRRHKRGVRHMGRDDWERVIVDVWQEAQEVEREAIKRIIRGEFTEHLTEVGVDLIAEIDERRVTPP